MLALYQKFDRDAALADIAATVSALRDRRECNGRVGGDRVLPRRRPAPIAPRPSAASIAPSPITASASRRRSIWRPGSPARWFCISPETTITSPSTAARAREAFAGRPDIRIHAYPGARHGFNRPDGGDYDKPAAGPRPFALAGAAAPRDRPATMISKRCGKRIPATSSDPRRRCDDGDDGRRALCQPRPGHDRRGRARDLARFYANHFIPKLPRIRGWCRSRAPSAPTAWSTRCCCALPTMSRSTGCCRGCRRPGAMSRCRSVAIVGFRGGKLCHEHIYWDQASVLVQIGLIDPKGLPVAGAETAQEAGGRDPAPRTP